MNNYEGIIIGAFFDGRPGHEKQTSGIIEQLKKKKSVEVIPVRVEKGTLFQQVSGWLRYWVSNGFREKPELATCDLLIGTGTHTHLPMLSQKKHSHIPAVTCMTPAPFIQNQFDLIFVPQHDRIRDESNVFKTIGPPNLNYNQGMHQRDRTLILLGGVDPQSHHWLNREIMDNVERLITSDRKREFIVSSSPRTPAETVSSLAKLAEQYGNMSFFDYRDTPSGWVEREYSLCEQVWVTGDSISMVYEALSSGCKVGIIPVPWRKKSSKFITSEQYLHESEMVIDLQAYLIEGKQWKKNVVLNEAARCADEIINRFL